ncbi:MAG TPA: hypothetical protein VGN49_15360, partial [Micrococcaceae bacterium]|nr:hypothetical protein [Micrococcaceae bacterium]
MAAPGGFPDWLRSLDPGVREQVAAALDREETVREAGAGGMVPAAWQDFDAWLAGAPDPGPLMVEPEDPYDPSLLLDPWEGFDPGALVDPDPSVPSIPTELFGSAGPSALAIPAAPFRPADASASSVPEQQQGPAVVPDPAPLSGTSQPSVTVTVSGPSDQSGPADERRGR